MSYRNYIGYISKDEYDKIKSFSKEQLYNYKNIDIEDDHIGCYDLITQLYEFGKYVDFDDEKYYKMFFENEQLNSEFMQDFYIIGKDFLKHIIISYSEKIKNYYTDMVKPFNNSELLKTVKIEWRNNKSYKFDFSTITDDEQTALYKMIEHIKQMNIEWNCHSLPFDLDKGDSITDSWKYEYSIFELVKIYKTFDWKNNLMIYYGY